MGKSPDIHRVIQIKPGHQDITLQLGQKEFHIYTQTEGSEEKRIVRVDLHRGDRIIANPEDEEDHTIELMERRYLTGHVFTRSNLSGQSLTITSEGIIDHLLRRLNVSVDRPKLIVEFIDEV